VTHGSNLPLEAFVIGEAVVRVAHGSKATINARSAKDFTAEVQHSGTLDGTVQAGILDLKAEHSAQVHLSGSARKATLKGAFSGRFSLGDLVLDAAEVRLDHSSSAVVNAKSHLDYNLGYSSHLRYAGNPAIGRSVASRESSARALRADEQKAISNAAPAAPINASGPASSSPARSRENGNEFITIDLSNNSSNRAGAGMTIFTGSPDETLIEGSGRQITKAVVAKDFSAIQIDRMLITDVTRADAFAVSLTADDNILERIEVVRDGSTLRISLANGNYRLRNRPRATITLPHLEAFSLGGASKATLKGFKSDKAFQLKVSGASEVDGAIDVGSADFQISGASSATMTGSARAGHLFASGASRLKLAGFLLNQCQLELDGASNVSLQVKSNQPFKAKLDGASILSGLVEATDLDLKVDGSSTADVRGSAKNAKLIADGASHLKLSELSLDANQMIVAASGTSSVKLAGKCRAAALEADGASHLDLGGLVIDAADVKLSGVSHATLDVRASLKYDLSSVSNLTYSGNPSKVDGKKSGGATISHR
jgi:serine/threonine-protein kinase